MRIYPIDEKHAVIIHSGTSYFFSRDVPSLYVHIPSEYPTMHIIDKKYKLPRFDNIIEDKPKNLQMSIGKGFEVGSVLYGNPYPPSMFTMTEDPVKIGVIEFPLEHRVFDEYVNAVRVYFGSVTIYTDPDDKKFVISFSPDGEGDESLFSMLYFLGNNKEQLNEIVSTVLRTLEWSNPVAYNVELDKMYHDMILARLRKILRKIKPLDYTPVYYSNGKILVEKPSDIARIDFEKIKSLTAFLNLL